MSAATKKASTRVNPKAKRDLFSEISEGLAALAEARKGKKTLRTHSVEFKPAPTLKPKDLVSLRKKLDVSRPIFAMYLRTNARTIENWEQGRAKPNAQAALLIKLVTAYPDTVEKLAAL
jgi:putative transcriptional regulator